MYTDIKMYKDYMGIILAGGKSTRMGENKSLLEINGVTVIERVVSLLSTLFPKLVLITNTPEEYSFLNLEMHQDIYPGKGPLAGIHSGLVNSKTENNFVISCDIPLMREEVIRFLVDYPTSKPITISKADNFIQQLCGVYKKEVLPVAERILTETDTLSSIANERNPDQKKRGCLVLELVKTLNSEIINIESEYPQYIPGTFYNMNSPAEFEFIKGKLSSGLKKS